MPSFDAVNYSVRPNKAVERKIVFSSLAKIAGILDWRQYRYIGMGSLWFVDFLIAHKVLSVSTMVSVEKDPIGFKRATFNRPLSCITVIEGELSLVIPKLRLEDSRGLMWFDYEDSIAGTALSDIALAVTRCASDSVILVTMNAKLDQLPRKDEKGDDIEMELSLRQVAGDLVPNPLPAQRLRRADYPKLLCEIIANQMASATLNSGRGERFLKLFDLVYSDGTPMVTVGGIIASATTSELVRRKMGEVAWEGILERSISIPPLTMREKIALDRLLPSPAAPTDKQMDEIGFRLRREQIDTYHQLYLHYPMFAEFL